jgi:hypothetical protein
VILSEIAGGRQVVVRIGEHIGAFRLLGISRTQITLEWQGSSIQRDLADLQLRPPFTSQPHFPPVPGSIPTTERPIPQPKGEQPIEQRLQATSEQSKQNGPGPLTTFGYRTCKPTDQMAEGTIVGGFRKTFVQVSYGKVCQWNQVEQ